MGETMKGRDMKGRFVKGYVQLPYNNDENHGRWKGDDAGYRAIHQWIARKLGTPMKCTFCLTVKAKRFHWANISGEYTREFKDWIRLCPSCHKNFDKRGENYESSGDIKMGRSDQLSGGAREEETSR